MEETWTMFLIFSEFCLWNAMTGNSFGLLMGTLARTVPTIVQVIPVFFVPFVLMAGFIVNTGTIR
jgi:hypothetical protein